MVFMTHSPCSGCLAAGKLALAVELNLPVDNRKSIRGEPMGNRASALASLERRVRRVAQRRGLSLLIAQKRNSKIEAHGGYMLRDDQTMKIVFGDRSYEFSADLDEIEVFLEKPRQED
jgi:hypothetical protein